MALRSIPALALISAVGSGCVHILPPVLSKPFSGPAELEVGVSRIEITPPPGLAMFGHGPEGRISMGRRHRLYCRAFVFARGQEIVALVPCDLSEMSLELQRKVAELVAKEVPALGGKRIIMSATHTHAGPGHYFGAANYNGPLSTRGHGFDEGVLSWIASRTARGIVHAALEKNRIPAGVVWERGEVDGLTRNRSYAAFEQNPVNDLPKSLLDRLMAAKESLDNRLRLPYLAVDNSLYVLRIHGKVEGAMVPVGVFAVFGSHGTVFSNANDVYHGDLYGYATLALENGDLQTKLAGTSKGAPQRACFGIDGRTLAEEKCPRVIAGIAAGIEGDVSPAWDHQSASEARRIGYTLAEKIQATFDSAEDRAVHTGPLLRAYRELELPGAWVSPTTQLCAEPVMGSASAGGSEDGYTLLRAFPRFNEGARTSRNGGPHGSKIAVIPPLGLSSDGRDFPAIAPVALVKLGNGYLGSVPVELTTVAGLRVRAAIGQGLEVADQDLIAPIINLATSYLQYVATEEEYDLQHYEGASTLYGPRSAEFFKGQFKCLARYLKKSESGDPSPETEGHCNDQAQIDDSKPTKYVVQTQARL